MSLSLEQGTYLVAVARRAVEVAVLEGRNPRSEDLPAWMGDGVFLDAMRGAFVTLTDGRDELRGCIGLPYPIKPLKEAVVHAAVGAATHDPRFPRVGKGELDFLKVEVSALTSPETMKCKPMELPSRIRVGVDGLIVSGRGTSGLLLPQVGTEFGAAPDEFLSMTCQKAGLLPDSWLAPDVEVKRFQAEVFGEERPKGAVAELAAPR
ncbi:MAG TPA: TIGR00296 family protein [Nitrososphaerales archaeon]|nr:TIGR00296 family protein [Nitrososphaerales archaeon]HUK75363.1 TIGR00296 family protein [Nitrososphaerales archaeon]